LKKRLRAESRAARGHVTFPTSTLRHKGQRRISARMIRLFDIDDRARLRERFFGATHAVLARL
jgi:hypothetical protein